MNTPFAILETLHRNADLAFTNLAKMPSHDPRQASGYLILMDKNLGIIETMLFMGECDLPNAKHFGNYCIEKADRLFHHQTHRSSYQSRNQRQSKYQGAIKSFSRNAIVSFSGYSEPEDEVIALMGALGMDAIDLQEAREIAAISSNTLFTEYTAKYGHEHTMKL